MAIAAGLFVWGRHYLTKVEEIDHQHEEIACLLNELHAERRKGAPLEQQRALYAALVKAVVDHFRTEESYMRRLRYEGFELHRAEHNALVENALALSKQLETGGCAEVDAGLEYIKDWLRNHLLTSDRRMGRFLAEKLSL
jgi:hemerythrin